MKHLYIAAQLIEDANLGEVGTDLFVGTLPADVHRGVMLRDPLTGAELEGGMNGFVHHQFQLIVRDVDPQAAYEKALALSNVLKVNRSTYPGIFILKMEPLQLPVTYPMSESDELETSVRVRVSFALLQN